MPSFCKFRRSAWAACVSLNLTSIISIGSQSRSLLARYSVSDLRQSRIFLKYQIKLEMKEIKPNDPKCVKSHKTNKISSKLQLREEKFGSGAQHLNPGGGGGTPYIRMIGMTVVFFRG